MTGLFRKGAALSADSRGHASAPIAGRRKRKARRRQSGCRQAKAGNGADCIVPCFVIRTCGPRKRRIVLCSLCKSANSAFSACGGRSGPMHGFESQFTVFSFSASTRLMQQLGDVLLRILMVGSKIEQFVFKQLLKRFLIRTHNTANLLISFRHRTSLPSSRAACYEVYFTLRHTSDFFLKKADASGKSDGGMRNIYGYSAKSLINAVKISRPAKTETPTASARPRCECPSAKPSAVPSQAAGRQPM